MRKLRLFFIVLISFVTVVHIAEAHDPMEIQLRNAWISYRNWENRLGPAVVHLNDLNTNMKFLKSSWDSANKAQRDGALSMLASIGGKSPAGFIKDCVALGLSLREEQLLRSALSDAISAVESQYEDTLLAEHFRNFRHDILLKKIFEHNKGHRSRTELDFKNPDRADWTIGITRYNFPCMGGCTMPMSSPNYARDSHNTDTECSGCKKDYYLCNQWQADLHKERPCTLSTAVTGWFTNNEGNLVYETRNFPCLEKHRWCTPTPALHDFF